MVVPKPAALACSLHACSLHAGTAQAVFTTARLLPNVSRYASTQARNTTHRCSRNAGVQRAENRGCCAQVVAADTGTDTGTDTEAEAEAEAKAGAEAAHPLRGGSAPGTSFQNTKARSFLERLPRLVLVLAFNTRSFRL